MKRRFQIAKALVHDPDILILDEPTAGVDVELRHELWNYLRELHNKGKTILLTTHYIEEAELLCDNVSIIDEGKILKQGSPKSLTEDLGQSGITVQLTQESIDKKLPMLDRITFGLLISVLLFKRIIPLTPVASLVLIILPKFPGFSIFSITRKIDLL